MKLNSEFEIQDSGFRIQDSKLKIYCLSGLGVDERAFQNLDLKKYDLIHIQWIDPIENESLSNYSKRLFQSVHIEEDYNLLGVSFGGMIAVEFIKLRQPKKIFLISSAHTKDELPSYLIFLLRTGIHRIIPKNLLKSSNFITQYFFGIKSKEDKTLLKQILKETDANFLKWAIKAISKWENKLKPESIRIHGDNDRILPIKFTCNYIIKDGGHFMIVNKAKEISIIIDKHSSL